MAVRLQQAATLTPGLCTPPLESKIVRKRDETPGKELKNG